MRASSVRALSSSIRRAQSVEWSSIASTSSAPPEFIAFPEFIHRASIEHEAIPPEEPAVRRSQAAQDGSSRIGMVELPTELLLAVNKLIEGASLSLVATRDRAHCQLQAQTRLGYDSEH